MMTRKFPKSLSGIALAAMAVAVSVAASADAATVNSASTAPVVDGVDIAMLNQEGVTHSNGKLWTDTPVLGQTFTTGNACAWLDAITVQTGTSFLATKTYSLRIGEVSSATINVIATDSATQSADVNAGDYVTFTLSSPVFLWADTAYGFDIAMTSSTTAWQTGIPYLNQNAGTNYTGGQGYSTGKNHVPGDTISLGSFDRVFHVNLTATATPLLTLRADPVTGDTAIVGFPNQDLGMSYYQVTSEGDSLDAADWTSLADQDFDGNGPADGSGNGWEEAGGSGKHSLAEAYLLGSSTIAGEQSVGLGKGYDPSIDARDLVFTYCTDTGRIVEGLVEYATSAQPGDANLDGVVDAADYIALKRNFGKAAGAKYQDGDFDLDGDVDANDLAILQANLGQAAAGATIPEPAMLSLLGMGGLAVLRRRRP